MKSKFLFLSAMLLAGLTCWIASAQDWAKAKLEKSPRHGEWVGAGPKGGGSSDFAGIDDVRSAISKLPPDQITGDLNAVADYLKALPSANGKLAVAGFCWGGGQSFRFACNRPDLKAACVFYGPPPMDAREIAKIQCPVYGFYGGNDNRISSTIPKTEQLMQAAGKTYEPVKYEGAGHGFMRSGEQPDAEEANKKARDEGWERLKSVLGKL
jgi:carboxymethylenebutenolidase